MCKLINIRIDYTILYYIDRQSSVKTTCGNKTGVFQGENLGKNLETRTYSHRHFVQTCLEWERERERERDR